MISHLVRWEGQEAEELVVAVAPSNPQLQSRHSKETNIRIEL